MREGKGWLRALLVCAVLSAAGAMAQERPEATNDTTVAAAATELTARQESPEAKVIALHRFVRDEVRQVATQWG